jgi:sulfur-carrier protein adenylyltransferase/sulfurtransferase
LENNIHTRFEKQISLSEIGIEGQQKISSAKVLVIGAGGLGCAVLPYLVSMGVGTIGIVDFDVINLSNLQRQICYKTCDVGKLKVEVMQKFLKDLNPNTEIQIFPERFDYFNAKLITEQYDIVVDCTDNFGARYVINDVCVLLHKPHVYAGIHKFEGQVAVFNFNNSATYRCVFEENNQQGLSCEEIGVLGVLPGVIGNFQALETIKLILGIGNLLVNKILVYNVLTHQHQVLKIQAKSLQKNVAKEIFLIKSQTNTYQNIDWNQVLKLQKEQNAIVIDLRNKDELPKLTIEHLQIPMSNLEYKLRQFSKNIPLILCCQSGVRSIEAINLLTKNEFVNLFNLEGGVNHNR